MKVTGGLYSTTARCCPVATNEVEKRHGLPGIVAGTVEHPTFHMAPAGIVRGAAAITAK